MALPYMPDSDQLARGWAFVLQYSSDIDRLCRRMCQDRDVRFEDLRQESCIRIARTFVFSYPPELRKPRWWIQYMVRRTHAQLAQNAARLRRHEAPMPVVRGGGDEDARLDESVVTDGRSAERAIEAKVSLSRAVRRATLPQLLAIEEFLEGEEREESGVLARRAVRSRRYPAEGACT